MIDISARIAVGIIRIVIIQLKYKLLDYDIILLLLVIKVFYMLSYNLLLWEIWQPDTVKIWRYSKIRSKSNGVLIWNLKLYV